MNIKKEIESPESDSDYHDSLQFVDIKEEYESNDSNENNEKNNENYNDEKEDDDEEMIDNNYDLSSYDDTKLSKILPEKSKHLYELNYNRFSKWKQENNIINLNENVIMDYLYYQKSISALSTLRSRITMIRSTININEDVDIFKYKKVKLFWKNVLIHTRYISSKRLTNIFCLNDIEKFLCESPDNSYLLMKVVLIISITGPCTLEDICKISINDIEDNGNEITLRMNNRKTVIPRTITGQSYYLFKKYLSRRPKNVTTNRLLLKYHRGKCLSRPITVKGFGNMAIFIARYLNLPNANEYRGVTFHQTAVALQRQNKLPYVIPLYIKDKKKKSNLKKLTTDAKASSSAASSSSPSTSSKSLSPSSTSSSSSSSSPPTTTTTTPNNNLTYEKPKIIQLVPINNNDNDNLQPSTELFKSNDNKTLYIHVNNSQDMDIIIVKR